MMRSIFIGIAMIFTSLQLSSQYANIYEAYIYELPIDSLQQQIDKLRFLKADNSVQSKANLSKVGVINKIKEYSDYLFYSNLWKSHKFETNEEVRILQLRKISSYPYYLVNNKILNKYARVLYEESIKALIYEYRGNLNMLHSVEVYPAFQATIYPFLKREIEASGGVWTRGEVPQLNINLQR